MQEARRKVKKIKFTYNTALFLIWVLIFAFIGIQAPGFLKGRYLINVMLKTLWKRHGCSAYDIDHYYGRH